MFVADPQKAPPDKSIIYKRPDDPAHSGLSWRDVLIEYNSKYKDDVSGNPLGLFSGLETLQKSCLRKTRFGFRHSKRLHLIGWLGD